MGLWNNKTGFLGICTKMYLKVLRSWYFGLNFNICMAGIFESIPVIDKLVFCNVVLKKLRYLGRFSILIFEVEFWYVEHLILHIRYFLRYVQKMY